MPRISRGSIQRQHGSRNWSIKFFVDGRAIRETTGTEDRELALAYLRRRVEEARRGTYVPTARRVTLEEMHARLLENYRFKRNRTDPSRHVKRLVEFFGNIHAEEITETRIAQYSRKRLDADGMTAATLR